MAYKGKKDILTRSRIELAIRQVKSARQAAQLLGVNRKTFRKYAERYGLYEEVKNQKGIKTLVSMDVTKGKISSQLEKSLRKNKL